MKNPHLPLLSVLSSFLLSLTASHAAVLITIDVSDSSNVVFSATGAVPTRDQTTPLFLGLTFMGFLTGNSAEFLSISGNLKSTTSDAFTDVTLSNATSSLPSAGVDLTLSKFVSGDMVFVTTGPAFTGTSSADFSSIAGLLPSVGTTGDIRPGLNDTITASIGTYQVIPEPSSTFLVLAAGVAAITVRRRVPLV